MSLNLLRSKLNERKKFRDNFLAAQTKTGLDVKKEINGIMTKKDKYIFPYLKE